MRLALLPLLLALTAAPALAAPPMVLSEAPDNVAVTIYRDPDRTFGDEIDRDRPDGLALIAETRTVTLPPGEVTVRFEGVAGGIVPQSAILFGASPRERNRDAALLSQAGLVDAFTGQQVLLRRTDPATGQVVEERVTVRSAADRLVVDGPRGVEAIFCSGLNQTLIYPEAPATLSAKPVLSMTTKDQPGGTITVTLAYLATGFDWDATYIATLDDSGNSMRLFGWLTMASGDETSFPDATASAVAGQIERSAETRDHTGLEARERARWLDTGAHCWPSRTTSDIALKTMALPPPPIEMALYSPAMADIVVTAQRRSESLLDVPAAITAAVTATSENLGDLKLYRIPVPVTVAAHSQKQVAFLSADKVEGELVYRSRVSWGEPQDPRIMFRFRNRKQDGLGEPLPVGKVVVYQDSKLGRQVVGEAAIPPRTVNEEVEVEFGDATDVTIETDDEDLDDKFHSRRHFLTVRNANPFPVLFELEFPNDGDLIFRHLPGRLVKRPGRRTWAITLAPNSERNLAWDVNELQDEEN